MAGTRTRATRHDEGTKQRDVTDQPTPFIGLLAAPVAAMLAAWVLHYAAAGFTLGPIRVPGSGAFLILVVVLVTLASVWLAHQAWELGADRRPTLRRNLTISTGLMGAALAFMIGIGPNWPLGILFCLNGWTLAAFWALPRLHVLRADARESGDNEDSVFAELGIKGFKFGKPTIQYDPVTGEPERAVYDVKHRLGQTRQKLAAALPNLESVVGAPEGLSRAVKPADGKSNHSTVTLMLKDPLLGRVPYNGPSHPGGSVADPALVGRYDDGEPVYIWICGGTDPTGVKLAPTGYAFMGMTRAGKTVTENRLLIDGVITRCGGTIIYLNKAKGEQDVAPIIDGVPVAILAPDEDTKTVGVYREALTQIKAIISYRQRELARHGISAWSAEKCFHKAPPGMDPMPALVVHMGEADAVLENYDIAELTTYIASKGLSTGVILGPSMQRWDHGSMPTTLRFNLGARFCFGIGDEVSAGFALSDQTINAGAHPENWRNTKPGRFFMEAIGVDDTRWPVSAKGIGDDDDDALYANMRRDCAEWGPRMAPLDRGSAVATRGWYDRQVQLTNDIRDRLTRRGKYAPVEAPTAPAPPPDDPAPPVVAYRPPTTPAATTAALTEEEYQRAQQSAEEDQVIEIDGEPLYGGIITDDPDDGPFGGLRGLLGIDPHTPLPEADPDDDYEFGSDKPDPPDEQTSMDRLDEALRGMLANPDFRDPDDPSGTAVVFRTGQLQQLYPFNSRQWFSPQLRDLAEGNRRVPPGIRIERADDKPGAGWYRMWPVAADGGEQNRTGPDGRDSDGQ